MPSCLCITRHSSLSAFRVRRDLVRAEHTVSETATPVGPLAPPVDRSRPLSSFIIAIPPRSERDGVCLWRFRSTGMCSSISAEEDVFLFRKDRDPSIGSSSIINELKIECDPGADELVDAGSKSLARLCAPTLLRPVVSWTGSGSNLFCMQLGHRHFSASPANN